MSLFQRIGVTFGVGSVRIAVALSGAAQFRGYPFVGAVLLEGGASDIEIMMLTVDFEEFWITGSGKSRSHHVRHHGRVTLCETLNVTTGSKQQFPFQMALPADARCSRRREGWRVKAEAHVRMAVDARSEALLKVIPPPEILAVQRAARDGFGFQPSTWDGSRPEVFYDFVSPPHMQSAIDGIAFRLRLTDDAVVGDLLLNRQEQGIGGLLGTLVGADRESIPFVIPRAELISKRGTPRPDGAHRYIAELLTQAGVPLNPS